VKETVVQENVSTMSSEAQIPQMTGRLLNVAWTLPFRSRPRLWLGAVAALATLAFLDPSLRTGMQGLVWVAAIAATKEVFLDFVIHGDENGWIDSDTTEASAGFAVMYLVGLIALMA
jgi:hypothetical protein